MKKTLKINTKVIKALELHNDLSDYWQKHYNSFNGDILEFLSLENITIMDRLRVAIMVLPEDILMQLSLCDMLSGIIVHEVYEKYITYLATDSQHAYIFYIVEVGPILDEEQEYQIDALIWLIEEERAMKKG